MKSKAQQLSVDSASSLAKRLVNPFQADGMVVLSRRDFRDSFGIARCLIAVLWALELFVNLGDAVAFAQIDGQIGFANFAPGVNAPVFDAAGNPITGPGPYVADLFWSINTNAAMDSLTAVGRITPFAGPAPYGPGYFFGGDVNLPFEYLLAQVRVWDTNYGTTYYQARDGGGEFGFSNLIVILPLPPPGLPGLLTGLQSFQLQRLPSLSVSLTTTNTLLLSWPVDLTSYAVQQNPDLNSTHWTTLTNTPAVVDSQNQVILAKTQATMYYRLVSQ
jgi:hypothetical protein